MQQSVGLKKLGPFATANTFTNPISNLEHTAAQKEGGLLRTREMMILHRLHVGLAKTIYIRCIYGIFGRKFTKYTVYIYGPGQP